MRSVLFAAVFLVAAGGCKKKAEEPAKKPVAETPAPPVDGKRFGGGTFKPAEADTIWYPRLAFEAIETTESWDALFAAKKTHWETPNKGTGKPELDGVKQKVDVVEQGKIGSDGAYLVLRVNKPAEPGPYPDLVTVDCYRRRAGDAFAVHTKAWAPAADAEGPLWPLLVEACKTVSY